MSFLTNLVSPLHVELGEPQRHRSGSYNGPGAVRAWRVLARVPGGGNAPSLVGVQLDALVVAGGVGAVIGRGAATPGGTSSAGGGVGKLGVISI